MTAKHLFDGEVTAAEGIVRALIDSGVEYVLGMPGGNTQVIFDALYDHRHEIRTVLVREESLGSIMAEVYGKTAGKPAAILAQGSWVLSNCAMGMLEALTSSTPMVILTDMTDGNVLSHHAAYQSGTGEWGNWDAKQALDGFTKLTTVVHTAVQAVQHVQLAVKHASAGQAGPVAIVFHGDSLQGPVRCDGLPQVYASGPGMETDRRPAAADGIQQAAAALAAATAPVIIAGNGVRMSRAFDELVAFAVELGIPVATTNAGKGVFPERHPLALGLMGSFGTEAANATIAEADVVFAVGTKLGAVDTCGENPALLDPARQTLIQVDIESRNVGWTFPVDHALIGDARSTLAELSKASQALSVVPFSSADRVAAGHARGSFEMAESFSDGVPVTPQRLIFELSERLPRNAILTCDAGENRLFASHGYRTGEAGGFVQPAGIGGMGFAIPAAMGAKLARPDRVAVAFCGDGGFAMGMNGLLTSLEEQLPIVVVVMNNQLLGWVRHDQGDRPIASELSAVDHAAIANAMGCVGVSLTDPADLPAALEEAVTRPVTTVLDVRTDPEQTWKKAASSFASPEWRALVMPAR